MYSMGSWTFLQYLQILHEPIVKQLIHDVHVSDVLHCIYNGLYYIQDMIV